MPIIKNKREKGRFALVGAISTSLDFGILFILHTLGLTSIVANFFSTGTAFCFSFVVNRSFTFRDSVVNPKKQLLLYFLFTFFGLWVLQPLIIWMVEPALEDLIHRADMRLFIAKLLATGVTLLWNYFSYSRVVFKKHDNKEAS